MPACSSETLLARKMYMSTLLRRRHDDSFFSELEPDGRVVNRKRRNQSICKPLADRSIFWLYITMNNAILVDGTSLQYFGRVYAQLVSGIDFPCLLDLYSSSDTRSINCPFGINSNTKNDVLCTGSSITSCSFTTFG